MTSARSQRLPTDGGVGIPTNESVGLPTSRRRIGEREQAIKELETRMAAPGFYDDRAEAESVIARHRDLMWEVGDLMGQWESVQSVESADNSQ